MAISFRKLAAFLLIGILLLLARRARADRPELRASIDAETCEVGDVIHLSLQATTEAEMPSDPLPGPHPGFAIQGTSTSPTQMVTIVNGVRSDKHGLSVTWSLRAERVGTFALGPPSVVIAGARSAAGVAHVKVVAAGLGPRRPAHDPSPQFPFGRAPSTFDPWKGMFDEEPEAAPQVITDPRLALDAPRAPGAFLHATIDKASVMVGEQVTFTVLLYVDATEREPEFNDVHEATASDFVKHSLMENESQARPAGNALVAGRLWAVKLVRKSAYFPLKAGDLEIGPMSLAMTRGHAGTGTRQSERAVVHVTEPPLRGRPPGYVVGDVGNFALSADVTPRDVEQDGAVGVTVELRGTGNLPAALPTPVRPGLEWLEPQLKEKLGPVRGGDRFGGSRTFSFVVRVHKSGDVDLGELTVPFWDPAQGAYGTARASLGKVRVTPRAAPTASADKLPETLPGLPAMRVALEGIRPARAHWSESPLFFAGLGASPLAYAVAMGARGALRRIRRRRADRAASPITDLEERQAEAERACRQGDGREAALAVLRVLESAAIAKAGVNVRGVAGDEVRSRLVAAGVDEEHAKELHDLLRDCAALRFSPETPEIDRARDHWKRAKRCIAGLVVLFVLLAMSGTARADPLFFAGVEAIKEDRPQDAIADFEALADQGLVDPAASYDRGLAYASRVRAGAEIPGDLGHAAHAFEEARELTRDPALERDATAALTVVRSEIARRRARAGEPAAIDHGPTLGRSIVRVLGEDLWALVALLSSLALGVGLFVRSFSAARRANVQGSLACAIATPILALSTVLTLFAREDRRTLREGVIVTAGARPSDERHLTLPNADPIAEGARVQIVSQSGGWARIRSGSLEAFVPQSAVLPFARRE